MQITYNLKLTSKYIYALIFMALMTSSVFAEIDCGVNFVRYVSGEMPADISKNPMINMWDERFNAQKIVSQLKSKNPNEVKNYLKELSLLVHKDKCFQ